MRLGVKRLGDGLPDIRSEELVAGIVKGVLREQLVRKGVDAHQLHCEVNIYRADYSNGVLDRCAFYLNINGMMSLLPVYDFANPPKGRRFEAVIGDEVANVLTHSGSRIMTHLQTIGIFHARKVRRFSPTTKQFEEIDLPRKLVSESQCVDTQPVGGKKPSHLDVVKDLFSGISSFFSREIQYVEVPIESDGATQVVGSYTNISKL